MSYLSDFLFAPARARSPIKSLSGGEHNRLLLAGLFSKPANVLVLDEPTNDLDIESLELLEELLAQYPGTLLLVSHDRRFLDNVVTSTLVFEGKGQVNEYVGGYEDWLRQRPAPSKPAAKKKSAPKPSQPKSQTRKLSYHEQRELAALPEQIEKLESEVSALQTQISDPQFYQSDPEQINQTLGDLKKLEEALQIAYARWEALENS